MMSIKAWELIHDWRLAAMQIVTRCSTICNSHVALVWVQLMQQVHSDPSVPQLQVMRKQVSRILQRFTSKR